MSTLGFLFLDLKRINLVFPALIDSLLASVPFLRNFHWGGGGKTGKKAERKI